MQPFPRKLGPRTESSQWQTGSTHASLSAEIGAKNRVVTMAKRINPCIPFRGNWGQEPSGDNGDIYFYDHPLILLKIPYDLRPHSGFDSDKLPMQKRFSGDAHCNIQYCQYCNAQ